MSEKVITFSRTYASHRLLDLVYLKICDHFSELQDQLGYQSIWSIDEVGFAGLDHELLSNKPRRVIYRHFKDEEVSMIATDGTIKQMWFAAESCIRQSGTHHRYIENFEVEEDGSLILITGS